MSMRWDKKRVRERTVELMEEQLFCDLYATLEAITKEHDAPSPAQLWDEAAKRWQPLLTKRRPDAAVTLLKEELTEEYGELAAFLVLMIVMYMLVAMYRPDEESPYRPYCVALADATKGHPLLPTLYEGVRQTEDKEDRLGRKVGIVRSLLAEMNADRDTINCDTIEECIMKLPTYESRKQHLERADTLLCGTVWSSHSNAVLERIIAEEKARQQQEMQCRPNVLNNYYNTTNIAENYGAIIDQSGGTVNLPLTENTMQLPQAGEE